MPGWQALRHCSRVGDEVVRWHAARKAHAAACGWLKQACQVAGQVLPAVGLVDVDPVEHAVGIVQGDVEGARADQGSQGRHRGCWVCLVGLMPRRRQLLREKPATDHQRMAGLPAGQPAAGERTHQLLHRLMPRVVGQVGGPGPLHAQRRLAPAGGSTAMAILDRHCHPRAGHARHCLPAKLQRHAGHDRQKKDIDVDNTDAGGSGHSRFSNSPSPARPAPASSLTSQRW